MHKKCPEDRPKGLSHAKKYRVCENLTLKKVILHTNYMIFRM